MANINIYVEERPNTPPTINNISVLGSNRITMPLTLDNFVVDGGYSDSQGDSLGLVKINSLPSVGSLIYGVNDDNVTVGQSFSNSDLNNGVLKYRPIVTDAATSGSFNFQVSDDVDFSSLSTQKSFNLNIPIPPTYGEGFGIKQNFFVSQNTSILFNWNLRAVNNYTDINLGVLRTDPIYSNSPIYTGPNASKIVIESFSDDIIVSNDTAFNWWVNYTVWNPNPSGVNVKQILNSSNTPISLPFTINLPSGNTPVANIGLKINLIQGELLVPTTVGTSYSSYRYSVRRFIVGYKIYSGNNPVTPTLYTMWYKTLDSQ